VAREEVPTLVKYADRSEYLAGTSRALETQARQLSALPAMEDWCRLVSFDPQGEQRVLASALFRFGEMDYSQALTDVESLDLAGREHLAAETLGRLARFEIPLRELEHTTYSFELVVDQGAYFEIKRHRMMTQTPQPLTAHLGFSVPRRMEAAGFAEEYCRAMHAAGKAYARLAEFDPHLAAYVVPNGYHRRVLLTFNLRSAYHFCSLRAAPNAHFSVRRAALRIADLIHSVHPALAAFMELPKGETWQSVEDEYFVDR
jgi:hypothetical protein